MRVSRSAATDRVTASAVFNERAGAVIDNPPPSVGSVDGARDDSGGERLASRWSSATGLRSPRSPHPSPRSATSHLRTLGSSSTAPSVSSPGRDRSACRRHPAPARRHGTCTPRFECARGAMMLLRRRRPSPATAGSERASRAPPVQPRPGSRRGRAVSSGGDPRALLGPLARSAGARYRPCTSLQLPEASGSPPRRGPAIRATSSWRVGRRRPDRRLRLHRRRRTYPPGGARSTSTSRPMGRRRSAPHAPSLKAACLHLARSRRRRMRGRRRSRARGGRPLRSRRVDADGAARHARGFAWRVTPTGLCCASSPAPAPRFSYHYGLSPVDRGLEPYARGGRRRAGAPSSATERAGLQPASLRASVTPAPSDPTRCGVDRAWPRKTVPTNSRPGER